MMTKIALARKRVSTRRRRRRSLQLLSYARLSMCVVRRRQSALYTLSTERAEAVVVFGKSCASFCRYVVCVCGSALSSTICVLIVADDDRATRGNYMVPQVSSSDFNRSNLVPSALVGKISFPNWVFCSTPVDDRHWPQRGKKRRRKKKNDYGSGTLLAVGAAV